MSKLHSDSGVDTTSDALKTTALGRNVPLSIPGVPMDQMQVVLERLQKIEAALDVLVRERKVKGLYTVGEVAERLGKAPFTVRQWCRLGRVRAQKRECGRGPTQEWVIPHEELVRLENEGLLPLPRF